MRAPWCPQRRWFGDQIRRTELDTLTRTIPARQRELLFLRYERDLTDDEIGEILGLTASGVRSLSTRSIESLRRHPELLK